MTCLGSHGFHYRTIGWGLRIIWKRGQNLVYEKKKVDSFPLAGVRVRLAKQKLQK